MPDLLTINEALAKAKTALRSGNKAEAKALYGLVLSHEPRNAVAKKGIRRLTKGKDTSLTETQVNSLGESEIARLNSLLNLRAYEALEKASKALYKNHPEITVLSKFLSVSLLMQKKFREGLQVLNRAIKSSPNDPELFLNRGNLFLELRDLGEAKDNFLRSISLDPDCAEAYRDLAQINRDMGEIEEAIKNLSRSIELSPNFFDAYSDLFYLLSYLPNESDENDRLLSEYRKSVELERKKTFTSFNCPKEADRLRVGFVSGDFRNHPVGYWTEGFLAEIDNSKIELIAYPTLPNEDELTRRLRSFFSKWQPVYGQDDEAVAKMIHDDHIHVLFDMSGHTQYNRLPVFAWKPAPVQVSWLGYFATTGLNEMDYILGDPYVTPESEEDHFVENIWPMPESYVCFTPPDVDIEINELPAILSESITFGCFNNLIKINDEVVSVWSRILKELPGSRMFLKTKTLNSEEECRKIKERFLNHGVESGRLILEGESPRSGLLAAYQRVDIALDPFPYPGGTTSAESVWMGVPVVTLRGKNFLSHVGESIIINAGLPDWVAIDEEDYVRRAIDFASDLDALSSLRSGLRAKLLTSPLYDTKRFARYFETAVRDMWKKWLEKQNG